MNTSISELAARIKHLEDQIESEIKCRRAELHADFDNQKIEFEQEVLAAHKRLKAGLAAYVGNASWLVLLTAPIIYFGIIPLLLLDLFLGLYQLTCFPVYRIPRVRRSGYMVFDRGHLAYLNVIEKLNCAYCSYANGLAGYAREIIGRTELYWCPIKHARRILNAHAHYNRFLDFGDAAAYGRELENLRQELAALGTASKEN